MTESLGEVAGTEVLALDGESVHRRMRASTVDEWFGVVAQPNRYVEPDPAPAAVQALDWRPWVIGCPS
jgi:hypothetical protein